MRRLRSLRRCFHFIVLITSVVVHVLSFSTTFRISSSKSCWFRTVPPRRIEAAVFAKINSSSSYDNNNTRITNSDDDLPVKLDTTLQTRRVNNNRTEAKNNERGFFKIVGRRDAFRYGTVLTISSLIVGTASTSTHPLANYQKEPPQESPRRLLETNSSSAAAATTATTTTGKLEPVNLTQIVSETSINVTMNCDTKCVSIDSSNFTFNKVATRKLPNWLPSMFTPSPQIVKTMTNNELLVAATVAGSVTEMGRTLLLYPLQTIKVRVQAATNSVDQHSHHDDETGVSSSSASSLLQALRQQVTTLGGNIQTNINAGDLYAGITPSLLVSVPSTGIYYGVRDVTKRMLYMTPLGPTWVAVVAATVGDVISLCFRTPSETLSIRLQTNNETVGNWWTDSFSRLPMVIATDLPYLLSKIVLNRSLIQGQSISVSHYAEFALVASVVAGFLTTPFDVARTRILLNEQLVSSSDDGDNEEQEQEEINVVRTMIQITNEGNGGIKNLYAGWLERVLYLGVGRAWLEPVSMISYIGIRDTVLLEWF